MNSERQHQEQMLRACDIGDTGQLQELLKAASVEKGDSPIKPTRDFPIPASGPAATSSLLAHAVAHSHPKIVTLLLETYPTAPVRVEEILSAAFEHPHLETFKLLYERDNSIVNHEFEEYTYGETALMVACHVSDSEIPGFLLGHGADPNLSGLGLIGPLVKAVQGGQPLSIVEMMVRKGAWVTSASIITAIRARRTDVVKFFLQRCPIENEKQELEQYLRDEIEGVIDNKELKEAFEQRITRIG